MTTLTRPAQTRTPPRPRLRGDHAPPLRLDHLDWLLTDIGLWQHMQDGAPSRRHGYSIDDEARGLLVALGYWKEGRELAFMKRLGGTCFRFVQGAAVTDGPCAGRYHNFCDDKGQWLDSIGSDDSFGRTLWALGVAHAADAPFAPRAGAETLLLRSLPQVDTLHADWLRAKAFVVLGLAASRVDDRRLARLANALADAYETTAGHDWQWFENHMTYCNARLPQALFVASQALPNGARCKQIAAQSLDFLLNVVCDEKGCYSPIGNARLATEGWYLRGERAPHQWDQQPVDAGALTEACVAGFHATGQARYAQAARRAFAWYTGENWHGLPLYDSQTGGVADALHQHGTSRNQGAESVVSIHLAWQALQTLDK